MNAMQRMERDAGISRRVCPADYAEDDYHEGLEPPLLGRAFVAMLICAVIALISAAAWLPVLLIWAVRALV